MIETRAPAPEFSPNSKLEMLVQPTLSMICSWGVMENIDFINISNNFHDCRNYGSGSRAFSKLEMLENVGIANIVHR